MGGFPAPVAPTTAMRVPALAQSYILENGDIGFIAEGHVFKGHIASWIDNGQRVRNVRRLWDFVKNFKNTLSAGHGGLKDIVNIGNFIKRTRKLP